MDPSAIVMAFLEYLVDPMLPAKASTRDTPTLPQQQSLAKQVHSVVLLYNYYHRKQHPELEFLAFDEFCKLAVALRPSLLTHLKFTQECDETEHSGVDKQLSLTEQKVMEACGICRCLDTSKTVPNIGRWPISRVAVLLIDYDMENCFLLFGSITEGVWSLIEKNVDISSESSEVAGGIKSYKKRKVTETLQNEKFLQVAYSAVKEAAGVNKTDIMLLGSYTVYSQSKEKTASRFFIMKKSSHLINQEANQVPIKDLIERLQGPLVRKSSSSWTVTPVVEYFHLLPYSEVISEWFSRETFSNSLHDSKLPEKNAVADSAEETESNVCTEGMHIGLNNKPCSDNIESLKQKENNVSCTTTQCGSMKKSQDMDVDNSSVFPSQNRECQLIVNTLQVSEDKKIQNQSVQLYSNGSTNPIEAEKVDSRMIPMTEFEKENHSACNKMYEYTSYEKDAEGELALIANNSCSDIEKLQILLDSKGKALSQTALTALRQKRNELTLQHRLIEDEIALCDQKIQRILADGEDALELKIESIIEGCNYIWEGNKGRMCKNLEDQCLHPYIKMKSLTEAVLIMQTPCQELDSVCHENNWILPIYHVSQSDGGFQADVTMKGLDFECSCQGNLCSSPREARESAAAHMKANLRSMQELRQ